MKLEVPFECEVEIRQWEKYYTGHITFMLDGLKPRTFYFLLLNPYGGVAAEFSLYNDADWKGLFTEAIGVGTSGINPQTGKPMTAFDFTKCPVEKHGVVFIAINIIMEAVYKTERRVGKARTESVIASPSCTFKNVLSHTFDSQTAYLAQGFIDFFKSAET